MVNTRPRTSDALIHCKAPSALKEAFVAAAKREGIGLTEWLLAAGREKLEREKKP